MPGTGQSVTSAESHVEQCSAQTNNMDSLTPQRLVLKQESRDHVIKQEEGHESLQLNSRAPGQDTTSNDDIKPLGNTRLRKLLAGGPISPSFKPVRRPRCGCSVDKCCPVFCKHFDQQDCDDVSDDDTSCSSSDELSIASGLSQEAPQQATPSMTIDKYHGPGPSKERANLIKEEPSDIHQPQEMLHLMPGDLLTKPTYTCTSKATATPFKECATSAIDDVHLNSTPLDIADDILKFPEGSTCEEAIASQNLTSSEHSRMLQRSRNSIRERRRVESINYWLVKLCERLDLDSQKLTKHQMLSQIVKSVHGLQQDVHRLHCEPECPHAGRLKPTPATGNETNFQVLLPTSNSDVLPLPENVEEPNGMPSTKRTRRKLNAYLEYCRQHRDEFNKRFAGSCTDITQQLAAAWGSLTAEQQSKYH